MEEDREWGGEVISGDVRWEGTMYVLCCALFARVGACDDRFPRCL